MPNYPALTVGAKPFLRSAALERLLRSAERIDCVDRVIVADDGETSDRAELYNQNYGFDLEVHDLEYDAGIGAGRQAIVQAFFDGPTEYLMMSDPDMRLPRDLGKCAKAIDASCRSSLGAVAPMMYERGRPKAYAQNFRVDQTPFGDVLCRGVWEPPELEVIGGVRMARLDMVPNLAVYCADMLDDYHWDPQFRWAKDHLDMMHGHWDLGEWDLAVALDVYVRHSGLEDDPEEYQIARDNRERKIVARRKFFRKWGYHQMLNDGIWFDSEHHPFQPPNRYLKWAPSSVRTVAMDVYDSVVGSGVVD